MDETCGGSGQVCSSYQIKKIQEYDNQRSRVFCPTFCNRSAKTIMTTSTLTGSALQASRAAVTAMEDKSVPPPAPEDLEPGEIQEIDMESQADSIRTVFSDPTNFNVKVCSLL